MCCLTCVFLLSGWWGLEPVCKFRLYSQTRLIEDNENRISEQLVQLSVPRVPDHSEVSPPSVGSAQSFRVLNLC